MRLRKKGEHHELEGLGEATRRDLLEAAERVVAVGVASAGRTRGEIEALRATAGASPRDLQIARGLEVVFDDASAYEGAGGEGVVEARLALFEEAARRRKADVDGATFDRDVVLAAFAEARGTDVEVLERSLYADRKREERLLRPGFTRPDDLVARWALARVQAVLLRALSIDVDFDAPSPDALRRLLRAMRFHQLLHTVELDASRASVRVDGASSLFDATTKYGLRYATLVPAMIAAGAVEIRADLKGRPRRAFRADERLLEELRPEAERLAGESVARPEVEELRERFPAIGGRWRVETSARMLAHGGNVVCAPDLDFVRDDGLRVAFELMGYWSRRAVWSRIEAVEDGLVEPALFAVSERLRVSKEAMPKEAPSALYVFKGTLRPKAILEHLERLAERCDARRPSSIATESPKAKRRPRKAR